VTAAAAVCAFTPFGPQASSRHFKLLQRSQDASGNAISDAPPPPPLPQHALIWFVVAALLLVLVRAAWTILAILVVTRIIVFAPGNPASGRAHWPAVARFTAVLEHAE
jgi:hypothetical protein